jgi:hypothetical protein
MNLLKRAWLLVLATVALVGCLHPAHATTVVPKDFTCPVGGERFTANVIVSFSSWGQRPDGRSYGTLPIYPIVKCPKNGLLLTGDDFTPADVAILTPLVASAEYQAMRKTETPHFRAWWLLSRLQRDPHDLAGLLLQASWETDADLDRKARYQGAFIAAATALKRNPKDGDSWFFFNMRAANALRELGYFDKAVLVLNRIDRPELLPKDAAAKPEFLRFLAGLRLLISERNPTPEPANLLPKFEAARRCEVGAALLSPSEVNACSDPQLAEPRKQIRKAVEKENRHKPKVG